MHAVQPTQLLLLLLLLAILVGAATGRSAGGVAELSCKDDNGRAVDWFLVYKLPKLKTHSHPLVRQGHAFTSVTSAASSGWRLSERRITDPDCILANTIVQKNLAQVLTLGYSDQTPLHTTHTSQGHAKGVVLVSSTSGAGVWISHSAPLFPTLTATNGYNYPETGTLYGQHFLCLTLTKESVDTLGKHLQAVNPHVYYSGPAVYVPSLATKVPHLMRVIARTTGSSIPRPTTVRSEALVTRGGLSVKTFAKRSSPELDLYSDAMAPSLGTSLRVQTWMRSAGVCLPKRGHGNIWAQSLSQLVVNARADDSAAVSVTFSTGSDHSKWAVSTDSTKPWFCVADLNRKDAQIRRSGGAACVQLRALWVVFDTTARTLMDDRNCTTAVAG